MLNDERGFVPFRIFILKDNQLPFGGYSDQEKDLNLVLEQGCEWF